MKAVLSRPEPVRTERRGELSRRARSLARRAAAQALYQIDLTATPADTVIEEFLHHRFPPDSGPSEGTVDRDLFAALVRGTAGRVGEIDALLSGTLAEGWSVGRLDMVLRAVLRAGIYELIERPDIPAKVAISEYVEVAHAFLAGDSVGFVNGVLDRLARRLRAAELGFEPAVGQSATANGEDHDGRSTETG